MAVLPMMAQIKAGQRDWANSRPATTRARALPPRPMSTRMPVLITRVAVGNEAMMTA